MLACVAAIAAGQILFKVVALRLAGAGFAGLAQDFRAAALLIAALALYAAVTPAWLWVLRSIPLGQAYLFMSLSFAVVPVMAHLTLGERLPPQVLTGALLIVAGVVITTRGL
jgi:drug/metabolite transporter (DMT)-like permease